jgi:hypothetical protein
MIKPILSLRYGLLIAAASFALISCGGGSDGPAGASATGSSTGGGTFTDTGSSPGAGAGTVVAASGGGTVGGSGGSSGSAATIPPAGQPGVLVSNQVLLQGLRNSLAANEPAALRFKTMVDQQLAGADFWGFENWNAALVGVVTGESRYCDYAVRTVDDFVTSEERAIAAGSQPAVADDDYLQVGGLITDVALVYDWCRPQMDSSKRSRWIAYANQAVFNAWNRHTQNMDPQSPFVGTNLQPVTDYTPWGANNPKNNYYYSFLTASMMLGLATRGDNPQADSWLNQFRTVKLQNQLIPIFNTQLTGGGSREGTGYGVAMRDLFKLYRWWEASTGERVADLTPHTRASMLWMMHNMTPTLDRYATTGDQSRDQTGTFFDYQLDYIKVLMQLYPNDRLSGVAKSLIAQAMPSAMTAQFMYYSDYLNPVGNVQAHPLTDLSPTYFGSGTGLFATRSSWTKDAAYGNFICGPDDESHAHEDQGSFTLFRGTWLAIDANMQMSSGLAQDAWVHNLVRFEKNGTDIGQDRYHNPCNMKAVADNATYAYASADMTSLYAQYSAGNVIRAERRFLFIKPGVFVVFDPVQSAGSGMRRIWTLNVPGAPTVAGNRITYAADASNRLDIYKVSPASATIQDIDWNTVTPRDWSQEMVSGATEHRVDIADSTGDSSYFLHVLSTNGAVTSAPVADNAAGQIGAKFTLNDGRVVTVRFNTSGDGSQIQISNVDGSTFSQALPTAVQTLPEFVN